MGAQNEEQKDALQVDVTNASDIDDVRKWLQGGSTSTTTSATSTNTTCDRLDGLYMQYQPYMLTREGIRAMRTLTDNYSVGIWGANPKPDDHETFSRLVKDCGVNYVNSGLPK